MTEETKLRIEQIGERLEAARDKKWTVEFPSEVSAEVKIAIVHSTDDMYFLFAQLKSAEARVGRMEGLLRKQREQHRARSGDDDELLCEAIGGLDTRCDWCRTVDAELAATRGEG